MIGDVLMLLKSRLNGYFKTLSPLSQENLGEDKVVFLDGDQKADAVSFKLGAITLLLYRIEHDTTFRQGDPYIRVSANGVSQRVQPDIALNIHVLFVARFKDYGQGLNYLSQIIKFFQTNKVFNQQNTPELAEGIGELVVDLVSMSSQQNNELWGLLRTCYLPSVAYKIRTVIFRDEDVGFSAESVSDTVRRLMP